MPKNYYQNLNGVIHSINLMGRNHLIEIIFLFVCDLQQLIMCIFHLIRELLSKYVQCEDSTEIVKVQNDWLKDLQVEYAQAREKGAIHIFCYVKFIISSTYLQNFYIT
jgi:hypothetical protein